jgi:hypothetical protein
VEGLAEEGDDPCIHTYWIIIFSRDFQGSVEASVIEYGYGVEESTMLFAGAYPLP